MIKPIAVGFYGYSDRGKTTLIEKLIKELTLKGKKVSAIKQSGHPVSMDSEGKDTFRFSKAGANPVVLSSLIETTIKFKNPLETDEIIALITTINNPDIIIIESARDTKIRKIRIGDIELRDNTIWTYNGNFEELVNKILMEANNVSGHN
jgi:molybdopterin-guanine dinucleotide biosynthesis protein B